MSESLPEQIERFRVDVGRLREEIRKVVVGHAEPIEQVLAALLAGGHVLLEGVPGLGKTLLVRTLARCLSLGFSRVQCTPDLVPADILGTSVLVEPEPGRREFRFEPGPVFTHVLLADELNRATPKTQSALLEAMQEGAVTQGGVRRELPVPFILLATQNPIEMEGTYPLPEAQIDRFLFLVRLANPGVEGIAEVVRRTTGAERPEATAVLTGPDLLTARALVRRVELPPPVAEYAARVVRATHPDDPAAPEAVRRYVRWGASPRAAQALTLAGRVVALLDGRAHLSFSDVRHHAAPALRHRLILNFEGDAEGIDRDDLVRQSLAAVPEPS
ncbi:MAG: AAA family ATPase [Planctomycetes bacterium]|jgi:MoxR-like ATPase|nr:AAA family ATPase [Planctomycetota bacterium]